jgi:hypothetical protein
MGKVRTFCQKAEVKYPLLVIGVGLWVLGLVDQPDFHHLEQYVGISALMGAIILLV